jgi:hypothetical protein
MMQNDHIRARQLRQSLAGLKIQKQRPNISAILLVSIDAEIVMIEQLLAAIEHRRPGPSRLTQMLFGR